MSFTPLVRFRNFTVANLKQMLDVYPDAATKMSWDEATKKVSVNLSSYKRTAYQYAIQFGLEDRSNTNFKIQDYLYSFDDDWLELYVRFWLKLYYAPNPYIDSADAPMLVYCEIAEEILKAPSLELDFDAFFMSKIGGGSEDILLNVLKDYGDPIKHKEVPTGPAGANGKVPTKDVLYIQPNDKDILTELVNRIKNDYPIVNHRDAGLFFERFSYPNFIKFYRFTSSVPYTVRQQEYLSGYSSSYARNRIVFGAPGTGKSHMLETDKDKLLVDKKDYERVTFYPDYTYSQFVGTYKPVSVPGKKIEYKFVPGPFSRLYVKAVRNIVEATDTSGNIDINKVKPFILIVEEINRAKAATVFGDLFQLLDRGADGVSEYGIQPSEDLRSYLAENIGVDQSSLLELKLPDNFFIWATMNSADQGVFPMDTAFKRRWDFKYIGIDDEEYDESGTLQVPGEFKVPSGNTIEWNAFRKTINDLLSSSEVRINEDKLMGPFFINSQKYLKSGSADELVSDFYELVENKVLMYLYEDAAKTKRGKVFVESVDNNRFSSIKESFEKKDMEIFKGFENESFKDRYNSYCVNKTP